MAPPRTAFADENAAPRAAAPPAGGGDKTGALSARCGTVRVRFVGVHGSVTRTEHATNGRLELVRARPSPRLDLAGIASLDLRRCTLLASVRGLPPGCASVTVTSPYEASVDIEDAEPAALAALLSELLACCGPAAAGPRGRKRRPRGAAAAAYVEDAGGPLHAAAGKRRRRDATERADHVRWANVSAPVPPPRRARAPAAPRPSAAGGGPASGKRAAFAEVLSRPNLTGEQRRVLELVRDGKSVFYTGPAGTGKSYLMRLAVSCLDPAGCHVTASTGIAAVHVGGATLAHWAGVGGAALEGGAVDAAAVLRRIARNAEAVRRWRGVRTLVVDEISMVDGRFFSLMDRLARSIRRRPDEPFGGIQLLLSGDFFQLPPVPPKRGGEASFAFESPAWRLAVPHTVELTAVFRQEDRQFVGALEEIRRGRCSERTEQFLLDAAARPLPDDGSGIAPTTLAAKKSEVAGINRERLEALPGPVEEFVAEDAGTSARAIAQMDAGCPAPRVLRLAVGAQVMLVKNLSVASGLCNGSRGVVVAIRGERSLRHPVVRFRGGAEHAVRPERFSQVVGGRVAASREQLPLALAYAVSVHKSQGMQLDRCVLSLGSVFEAGQVYVALSRARTLAGLQLDGFSRHAVRAHPRVAEYYASLRLAEDPDQP